MPLYDYQCTDCETVFEELIRSPDDEKAVRCEHCGSSHVERQLSSFAMGKSRSGGEASSSTASRCSGGSCGSCRSSCCH